MPDTIPISISAALTRCPDCERSFWSLAGLEQHRRLVHSPEVRQRATTRAVNRASPLRLTSAATSALSSTEPHKRVRGRSTEISSRGRLFAAAHGGRCFWCGRLVLLDVDVNHPLAPTREHLMPRSVDPSRRNDPENIALAHKLCNYRRGTIAAEAYLRLCRGEAVTLAEMYPGGLDIPQNK